MKGLSSRLVPSVLLAVLAGLTAGCGGGSNNHGDVLPNPSVTAGPEAYDATGTINGQPFLLQITSLNGTIGGAVTDATLTIDNSPVALTGGYDPVTNTYTFTGDDALGHRYTVSVSLPSSYQAGGAITGDSFTITSTAGTADGTLGEATA